MITISYIFLLVATFSTAATLILGVVSAIQKLAGFYDAADQTVDWALAFLGITALFFFLYESCAVWLSL